MHALRRQPHAFVRLAAVDESNKTALLAVRTADSQRGWVASNEKSLRQASENPRLAVRTVVEGDRVVGLVMWDRPSDREAYIWRIMIGEGDQRRGLGRRALELALDELRRAGVRSVLISHRPENAAADRLFAAMGFKPFEVEEDGEIRMRMDIGSTAP